MFFEEETLDQKNKKLNINIALEKRWLAFLLGPGNCSGFMLNSGGGGGFI